MAGGTQLGVFVDLQHHPLGQMSNENFTVPSNYRIPPARIYVINHSRTRKWKRVVVPVSSTRGAEDALMYDKTLKDIYNAELLYKQVEKGRDMNRYKDEIKPVLWKLSLPGARELIIPPAHEDTPEKTIAVEVPEGTWDLYLGNYDRMRGYPGVQPREKERFDPGVQGAEQTALSVRWRQRHNPVFAFTDDGTQTDMGNPFGILEFVRITQKALQEPMDKDYLNALDLFEVT